MRSLPIMPPVVRSVLRPVLLAVGLLVAAALAGCVPNTITLNLDGGAGPVRETRVAEGTGRGKIALIDLTGVIGSPGLLGSSISIDTLAAKLDRAAGDRRVRAVVLRVNSPGGSVAASETMHGVIARFRRASGKPVVVSMGEVAASGGYYIALAADAIVAQPGTITGSVGVIIPAVNVSEGLGRIGVRSHAVTSGPNKDIANPLAPADPAHEAILRSIVDDFYARFRGLVLAARPGLTDPDTTLDGRVLTGSQALERGLVDELGSLMDAYAVARRLAGAPGASLVMYHRTRARPLTPYAAPAAHAAHAAAGAPGPRHAHAARAAPPIASPFAPFAWPTVERPFGSGAYYLWLAPGVLGR